MKQLPGSKRVLLFLFIIVILSVNLQAQDKLNDPYEIMLKSIETIGGLDNLKKETSSYVESDISIGGLQGTINIWSMYPILQRQDLDLKVFKNSSGDNGEYKWSTDANGKVQILKDDELLKRRELSKLVADYDYLDRDSKTFKLHFKGVIKIEENDCYSILTSNNSNDDSSLTFINCKTFMTEKTIAYTPDDETRILYSDYQEIDGVKKSFHQEITNLPVNQKVSVQITKYESNPAIDPIVFEPNGADKRDFRFTSGDRIENVPFEYIMNHIFIPVTVGCKERLWFLDTGAGISVIDSTFASELGLAFEGELAGQGVGNTVSFSFVKLPPMNLKGIEFNEQTIGSLNIQSLLQKAGLEAVGILGFDFISRFVIKVDYANKTLSFYDPETFEYDGSGIIIDAPLVGNNMTVKATVDGKYTGNWQLDLGAGGNSFHYPFAKANGFNKLDGIDRISLGAGGEMRSRGVLFNDFEIGGLKVNDLVFGIPQATKAGGFGGGDLIGNIGNSFLRHFTLYLDYNKQKLIVEKGGQFDHVFPLGKSGLQIMFDDSNNYEVICVSSNTPAENSGFKKGDILVSINGIDINNFGGLESIINVMKKPVGTKYSIVIYRGGAEMKLTLKLKDIY